MSRTIPDWLWALIILSGVGGALYLLYKYFVEPGNIIIDQYRKILEDIYSETKQFLEQNAELDPPIYGLTAGQQAIIDAKNEAAERLRPEVERIIHERGWQLWSWVETAVIGVILIYAAKHLIPVLSDLVKSWRTQNPEASSMIQSSRGHVHMIMELVANEYAYLGELDVASAFLSNIQTYYSSYTEPALTAGITYYQNLLPTLIPGTLAWLVANNMLTFMQYEVSATTGIMVTLWTWWLPPLI